MPDEKIDFAFFIVAASVFLLFIIIAVVLLFQINLKRKNKLLIEKERMAARFEQTLLKSKLEIQEQTFGEISKEIHDNIGQLLSMVRLNLNTMDHSGQPEKFRLMDELMEKAIADLRLLSHSLDKDVILDSGWAKAIEKMFRNLEKTGKYVVVINSQERVAAIHDEHAIILYRMMQEIINNIIRHANAKQITYNCQSSADGIYLSVTDDGSGMDGNSVHGAGLKNLKSRADLIGAEMNITSEAGKGTSIVINIKADEKAGRSGRTGR